MRLYEFESPLALFEDISGEEMLQVFRTMHHDAELNPEMDQYILSHDWELRNFAPDQFPDEEDFFDYDDPFDRVIDIDPSHRVNIADPIIVGPQYSDGKYSVIDGNHRAAAAQRAGKTIKGYFPVEKIDEAFDTDVEWVLDMDARNQQVYATQVDDAYIELTYKRIFPADVYIEFTRGGSLGVTGEGSQNKIFGAVINHIKQWVAKNKPPKIIFSAFKPHTGAFGAQDTTRSGLYRKMVQRFANQNGYSFDIEDIGNEDKFVLTRQNVQESGMVFSRKKSKGGVKTTQKFTCSSGPRAGKRVSSLAQCFAPIDMAKRIQMKKTRARTATRQARRARFTKRVDPSSLLTKILNKARKPGKPKK